MEEIGKLIQYDKLKKVKLGQIKDSWSKDLRPTYIKWVMKFFSVILLISFFEKKRLKKIKKSLIQYGYNPEKYGHILIIEETTSTKSTYIVKDGNRRIKVLKELHGDDYKILVMESVNSLDDETRVDGTLEGLWDGIRNLPIILIPSILFFLWYMFLEVMVVSIVCYFFMMKTTDISSRAKTEAHPKKYLAWVYDNAKPVYEILMTIYYNYRKIVLALIITIYTYHIINTYFIGLLIMVGITLILKFIVKKLSEDVNLTFPEIMKNKK
jgi:hypothetical protein|tara:strand:+ start:12112 stop:12915 length:804 start_codon:yes stop_codon:yes gene_type:complete